VAVPTLDAVFGVVILLAVQYIQTLLIYQFLSVCASDAPSVLVKYTARIIFLALAFDHDVRRLALQTYTLPVKVLAVRLLSQKTDALDGEGVGLSAGLAEELLAVVAMGRT